MVLLTMLQEYCTATGRALFVAHLDHGMRTTSARDAQFVVDYCAARGILCHVERAELGAASEATARTARQSFLRRTAQALAADAIVLAHHADDQAETVLLHLLRGTGLRGAGGMAQESGDIVRPWLHISREVIDAAVQEEQIAYQEDETNTQVQYLRNRVRAELLPLLEEYQPKIRAHLCQFAQLAQQDEAALAGAAKENAGYRMRYLLPGVGVSLMAQKMTPAIESRVIRYLLEEVFDQYDITQSMLEMAQCAWHSRKKTAIGHGMFADRKQQYCSLWRPVPEMAVVAAEKGAVLPDANVMLTRTFDGMELRTCRPGDRLKNGKLLAEVYQRGGVPLWARSQLGVVAKNGTVYALQHAPGLSLFPEAFIGGVRQITPQPPKEGSFFAGMDKI